MALGGKEYVCLFSLYVFPDNILDPVFALQGPILGNLEMILYMKCFDIAYIYVLFFEYL